MRSVLVSRWVGTVGEFVPPSEFLEGGFGLRLGF
jgi:hypothetical protein